MKHSLVFCAGLLACVVSTAQLAPTGGDVWSNVPSASDDRFTNPKSKLYAGPNGWHNFGEVRAEVANAAKTRYTFKSGLEYMTTPASFVFATSSQLQVAEVYFGTQRPAPGVYTVGPKANASQKKAAVSFMDSAHNKLLGWQSAEQSGTVTVTQVNKYLYFSARNLRLVPQGMHNQGDFKQPMALGFEGAVVAD